MHVRNQIRQNALRSAERTDVTTITEPGERHVEETRESAKRDTTQHNTQQHQPVTSTYPQTVCIKKSSIPPTLQEIVIRLPDLHQAGIREVQSGVAIGVGELS